MRAATCFSGIGAPECASPWLDWRWCAEIEPFPAAVHAHRFPGAVNLRDVLAPDFLDRAEGRGPTNNRSARRWAICGHDRRMG